MCSDLSHVAQKPAADSWQVSGIAGQADRSLETDRSLVPFQMAPSPQASFQHQLKLADEASLKNSHAQSQQQSKKLFESIQSNSDDFKSLSGQMDTMDAASETVEPYVKPKQKALKELDEVSTCTPLIWSNTSADLLLAADHQQKGVL